MLDRVEGFGGSRSSAPFFAATKNQNFKRTDLIISKRSSISSLHCVYKPPVSPYTEREREREMLGRVRRSSISSLEQLELERQPPKLMKSDSLSIYETTLLKLKEGSRRDISSCLEDSKGEEASAIDVDSSSCDSTEDSQKQQRKTGKFSLPYLFLRYRSSRQAVSSPDEDGMLTEDSCSSASTSPCPNIVQSSS